MPANLRFWVLSDTALNLDGASFTRMSLEYEVLWIDHDLKIYTTHDTGNRFIGNWFRLPCLHFEGTRFSVAGDLLGLMSDLAHWSNNPVTQEGTIYIVQHNTPTYVQDLDNDRVTLKWTLSLAYSLMALTPSFNGREITQFTGSPLGYLRHLVDNMPAKKVTEPYTGPRPTRFERILEED
jgi:hypothetical protein